MTKEKFNKFEKQGFDLVSPHIDNIKRAMFDPHGVAMRHMGAWLGSIVMTRQKYEVEIVDVGYDCSSYPKKSNESFDLTKYTTVGDFLESECSGNTVATYASGSGIACEMFSDELQSVAYEAFYLSLEKNFPDIYSVYIKSKNYDIDGLQWYDDVYNVLESNDCSNIDLESYFLSLSLFDTFLQYLPNAIEKIEIEKLEEKRRALLAKERPIKLKEIAMSFPEELMLFCDGNRFDKSNWKVLLDFLDAHDVRMVGATLRLVKLPVSNSVEVQLLIRYPDPVV